MDYREHAPGAGLADIVTCFWTLDGHARELGGMPQTILPDGCTELVIHFGDRFHRVQDAGVEAQPALILAGQLTSQLTLLPSGRIAVLGVRMRSESLRALIACPVGDVTGLVVDAAHVDGRLAAALLRVRETAASLDEAVVLARAELAGMADRTRLDPRVGAAVALIRRRAGNLPMDAVVGAAGTTPRHLERLFNDAVGMSPKRLARIARFQRAVATLERETSPARGAATALACGYADQAHFIREFRALAGCPPGEHLLRQAELTGFFISGRQA